MTASTKDRTGRVRIRPSLAPAGAIERIDRAFVVVRRGGLRSAAQAMAGGALPALVLLGTYFAERVEGIGVLRLPAAALLVLAFIVRSWAVASAAREYVVMLTDLAPVDEHAGGLVSVGRTALVVAFGLWLWSWGLLLAAGAGPLGVASFLPWLALRGLVAPSWLARAGCDADSGLRAFRAAVGDSRLQRREGLAVESLLMLALFGIAIDLYGVFAFAVLVGRSFLGLELALLDQFLSLRNTFVLLAVTLLAAVLLEPLRAALSAQVYVDARVRAEGLDLRAALDEAIGRSTRRRSARGSETTATRAAVVLLAVGLASAVGSAEAQRSAPTTASAELGSEVDAAAPEEAALASGEFDARARAMARAILARDIFRDVEARRRDGVREIVERLLAWLLDREVPAPAFTAPSPAPTFPLPGPSFFVALGIALALAVVAFLVWTRRADEAETTSAAVDSTGSPSDPRERGPDDWLAEATALAASHRFGPALRALYLATLVALDRHAWIRLEPSATNWQYLRQLPRGAARDHFQALTRAFDRKVYGADDVSAGDYREARELVDRILASAAASARPDGSSTGARPS